MATATSTPTKRAIARLYLATSLLLLALYTLAATLLLLRLGIHPAYAYNWEAYSAYGVFAFLDHPTFGIFRATEGLMTDSSFSPFVILPSWIAFALGGVGLWSLRAATALLAALAVPLLWWVGRNFVGAGTALLAALLLATSPVFLLYGRTATLVGLSLVPALATIEALRRLLHDPTDRHWLIALSVALSAGMYTYAPIRFLWPLALLFLALEYRQRPTERPALRRAFSVTLVAPWLLLTIASLRDPITALFLYFEGRGEQVIGLSFTTSQYGAYLRPDPAGIDTGPVQGNPLILAARLIAQNTLDLGNLLLDRGTAPALTDYGNAHGRLYPAFLVPFFALGLLATLRGARWRIDDRLLLALAAIWTLPLLFTSRVHIGRLIFFLPILCLLVAAGATGLCRWLAARIANQRHAKRLNVTFATLLAVVLLVAVANASWRDYRETPPTLPDAALIPLLHGAAIGATPPPAVALVYTLAQDPDPTNGIGEATQVSALRLDLDSSYQLVSLIPLTTHPTTPAPNGLIPLYFGNVLGHLGQPGGDALPCGTIFYVAPAALAEFTARTRQREATCGPPHVVAMP